MKEKSKEENKQDKKKEKTEKGKETKEEKEKKDSFDLKFHDVFSEVKESTPTLKQSSLEQSISQTEIIQEEPKKEKKQNPEYSPADYSSRNTGWHEKEMIADVDDMRRLGMLVGRQHSQEIRHGLFSDRPRIEMPELAETRSSAGSHDEIVKYAGARTESWKEKFDVFSSRDVKKYKREA